jgi:U3 small nucleolar RNA-associated protein 3
MLTRRISEALLTYGATLAYYLYLRASTKYSQKPESLRSHPVLKRLLTLKQSLSTLEELDFALSDEEESEGTDDFSDTESELEDVNDDTSNPITEEMLDKALQRFSKTKGLDAGELEALLMDAQSVCDDNRSSTQRSGKRGHKETAAAPVQPEPPKKKRKTLKSGEPSTTVFDLVEPELFPTSSRGAGKVTSSTGASQMDAFGEATSLQTADAQDKHARRKTLQFYTSKVESAGARRESARKATGGGDEDIPYKSRERRGKVASNLRGLGGEDLGRDDSFAEAGKNKKRTLEDDAQEEELEQDIEGYYSLVKNRVKVKKEKKKAEYEAERAASRHVQSH